METTEKKKKHNGGYYLKEKIAKLQKELENKDARIAELETNVDPVDYKQANKQLQAEAEKAKKDAEAKQKDLEAQSRKISQLTADLKLEHSKREELAKHHIQTELKMLKYMGPVRRWFYELNNMPTFKDDDRWNN